MGRVCPLPVTGVTGKKEENDMKRRIISVLLALVLVLSLLPTTVLATQPDAVPDGGDRSASADGGAAPASAGRR